MMDSLMAEYERKLAKWKRQEAYEKGFGTYISHLLDPYTGDALNLIRDMFTEPTIPPHSDEEFWYDFAIDPVKQVQVLEAQKYQEQNK